MSATANRRAYGQPSPTSRSSPPRPPSKKLPLGGEQGTVLGLGVPVASSRLDPLDEETAQMPGLSLPALLARCALPSDPNGHAPSSTVAKASADAAAPDEAGTVATSGIRPRGASFHTVPHFPEESSPEVQVTAESNLHQLEDDRITDALASEPPVSEPQVSEPLFSEPQVEVVQLRIGLANREPQVDSLPPSLPRPSRRRSVFAKALFVTIALGVGVLAAKELSASDQARWRDPRALASQVGRFVKDKIPWDRLPKILRK
jgi:hypothetical protein